MRPTFKTERLRNQSKAKLDEEILFCIIIHLPDPGIREMSTKGLYRNEKSMYYCY